MRTRGDIASECKRSTGQVAMFSALSAVFYAELTFTLGEAIQSRP
jgi:hypothetical protein